METDNGKDSDDFHDDDDDDDDDDSGVPSAEKAKKFAFLNCLTDFHELKTPSVNYAATIRDFIHQVINTQRWYISFTIHTASTKIKRKRERVKAQDSEGFEPTISRSISCVTTQWLI